MVRSEAFAVTRDDGGRHCFRTIAGPDSRATPSIDLRFVGLDSKNTRS